ncbi:MAG TPA: LysE family translocator [Spirochaetota bacterium]|nr:LysE family translocator [Spirochaetota bacterium]HPJ33195.1 LysE family translocator [Spirochaetota bacterium]
MILNSGELPFFLITVMVLLVTPGPDTMFIIATSLNQGRKHGVSGAVGVALSMINHSFLAAIGVAALVATHISFFYAIKYTGLAYLLFLAFKSFRENSVTNETGPVRKISFFANFRRGFLTNLLNPKAILFFSAFLTQFVNPSVGGVFQQFLVMGLIIGVMGFLYMSLLALTAGTLGTAVTGNEKGGKILSKLMGAVFILLAIKLFFIDRSE